MTSLNSTLPHCECLFPSNSCGDLAFIAYEMFPVKSTLLAGFKISIICAPLNSSVLSYSSATRFTELLSVHS